MNLAKPAGKEQGSPLPMKGGRSRLECFKLIKAKIDHMLLGEKQNKTDLAVVKRAGGCIM